MKRLLTLVLAEGLAFSALFMALVLFMRMNMSNAEITSFVSVAFAPWLLRYCHLEKFLPANVYARYIIVGTEIASAVLLVVIAITLRLGITAFEVTLMLFILSLCGSVHSVITEQLAHKATGTDLKFHFIKLSIGVFLFAAVCCMGMLVTLAGNMEVLTRTVRYSWSMAFYVLAGILLLLSLLHFRTLRQYDRFTINKEIYASLRNIEGINKKREAILAILLALYILPKGLLYQIAQVFTIDAQRNGGLGLSPQEYGFVFGTVGIIGIGIGSIIGYRCVHCDGLRRWLSPMMCAMAIPNIIYVILSYTMTDLFWLISLCVFVEQFGLGFGLIPYIFLVVGNNDDQERGFYRLRVVSSMALGVLLSGLVAGLIQEQVGYFTFFIIVAVLSLLTFIIPAILKIETSNGKSVL